MALSDPCRLNTSGITRQNAVGMWFAEECMVSYLFSVPCALLCCMSSQCDCMVDYDGEVWRTNHRESLSILVTEWLSSAPVRREVEQLHGVVGGRYTNVSVCWLRHPEKQANR
jgi:hypothetical protein